MLSLFASWFLLLFNNYMIYKDEKKNDLNSIMQKYLQFFGTMLKTQK